MDRVKADKLDKKIMEILNRELKGYIVSKSGAGRFSDVDMSMNIRVREEGTESVEVRDFKERASWFGLDATDLNKEFNHKGSKWKLVGLLRGRDKYPFLVENVSTGKQVIFPVSLMKQSLGKV